MRALITAAIVGLCSIPLAFADEKISPALARGLGVSITLEQYLGSVMLPVRAAMMIAPDGAYVLNFEAIERANARRRQMDILPLLAQFVAVDFNQDSVVTRREIEMQQEQAEIPTGLHQVVRVSNDTLSRADGDKDGAVSLSELYAYSRESGGISRLLGEADDTLKDYLSLGDGNSVTAGQVIDKALALFREMDKDSDTVISAVELKAVSDRLPPRAELDRKLVYPIPE